MPESASHHRARLNQWLRSPAGRHVLKQEQRRLAELLSSRFIPVSAQIGGMPEPDVIGQVPSTVRVHVAPAIDGGGDGVDVFARSSSLPFGANQLGLAVLFHTLELHDSPHEVLREVTQCLDHDGTIAIVGFNPLSIWSLWRPFTTGRAQPPLRGLHFSSARVQDWLRLLGFELICATGLLYRPPSESVTLRRRLKWMDVAGQRWLPAVSAGYILVAVKRNLAMTLLERSGRHKRKTRQIVQPVTTRNAR